MFYVQHIFPHCKLLLQKNAAKICYYKHSPSMTGSQSVHMDINQFQTPAFFKEPIWLSKGIKI